MTREQVQQQALSALIKNKGGTVVLDTGTGKTKVAIDYILQNNIVDIIILVPRINLKQVWEDELLKWGIKHYNDSKHSYYYKEDITKLIDIRIDTIQGAYTHIFRNHLLIIADEIHTMVSDTYKKFFYNHQTSIIIGLTATPEDNKPEKAKVYRDLIPIVYRFKKAAENGIINGRKYFVLRTDLSKENKKVDGWKYPISEFEVLKYWNRKVEEAGEKIEEYFFTNAIFNGNYFSSASKWCWLGQGDVEQKRLGWPYLKAVSGRKAFLLNQNTTPEIARRLLVPDSSKGFDDIEDCIRGDGRLVFSNQISQIQKILNDGYIVHSKKKKIENDKIIFGFNERVFNTIGSCESLEMGMNFKRANVAIFESYVGSNTKASQKMGRTDRLPINENAIIIIIYINNSPCDGWYRKSGFPNFDDPNVQVFNDVLTLKEAIWSLPNDESTI